MVLREGIVQHLLDVWIGHRADEIRDWGTEGPEGLEDLLAYLQRPAVADRNRDCRAAVWTADQGSKQSELVRSDAGVLVVEAEHVLAPGQRMDNHPPEHWADGVKLV